MLHTYSQSELCIFPRLIVLLPEPTSPLDANQQLYCILLYLTLILFDIEANGFLEMEPMEMSSHGNTQ